MREISKQSNITKTASAHKPTPTPSLIPVGPPTCNERYKRCSKSCPKPSLPAKPIVNFVCKNAAPVARNFTQQHPNNLQTMSESPIAECKPLACTGGSFAHLPGPRSPSWPPSIRNFTGHSTITAIYITWGGFSAGKPEGRKVGQVGRENAHVRRST